MSELSEKLSEINPKDNTPPSLPNGSGPSGEQESFLGEKSQEASVPTSNLEGKAEEKNEESGNEDRDTDKNEWVPRRARRNVTYEFEDGTHHVYTDEEGLKFFWDRERNGWFPKVDDFMAHYQINYAFYNKTSTESKTDATSNLLEAAPPIKGEKRKTSEPTWTQRKVHRVMSDNDRFVIIKNLFEPSLFDHDVGLIVKFEQVLTEEIRKIGQVRKVMVYDREPEGVARVAMATTEEADQVVMMLNGGSFMKRRLTAKIWDGNTRYTRVILSSFYNKASTGSKTATSNLLEAAPPAESKTIKGEKRKISEPTWTQRKVIRVMSDNDRFVIIKNLFEPSLFDHDIDLMVKFEQVLTKEIRKIGKVRKVMVYDREPEGIARVAMGTTEEADQVVVMLNGGSFMKRRSTAEIWDGKTRIQIKYKEKNP
ncbi:HIV Tat-specific factor 1-like [Sitophilus oryzae]|uniref:HIV Tat-specific factor 1-like n=1 Tax=Sitophilus oryzae TaxID=7048 RepID=A0A6J2XFW9_SITOR|nr:HIV Tat-specific factor 1-like [Sitophilus oryzae]